MTETSRTYGLFTVLKETVIDELKCSLTELRHEPTGARVMHIGNEDPENLFCLSFQTLPATSNGVAHILEHTVLCGSKKFPVKDPFFSMQRRSLNTFMNALTGSDFTCYPAASQVEKDFYNLLDVYLDAVFHPDLREMSFWQEGHRLEFLKGDDPETPLLYKGVVYNEMKGAMSSPERRLHEALFLALYPDITYGVNSGGDPREIPQLTYSELLAFHRTYYHQSRCLFFFYGNLPLEKHLSFIEDQALKNVRAKPPLPPIPLQRRFQSPVRLKKHYPLAEHEEEEGKSYLAFGFLTCSISDQTEALALEVLEAVLMSTDASPLKLALLRSGLCRNVGSFMEMDISELPFVLVAKGCREEDHEKMEQLIFDTLRTIKEKAFFPDLIERALHEMEFDHSEITGDQAPYGLSLFLRSALLAQHGCDAEECLKIHTLYRRLRKTLKDNPDYFPGLLKKHFLDNPHFVSLCFSPDKTLAEREDKEEKEQLATIRDTLSKGQIEEIIDRSKRLKEYQEKLEDQDLSVLPKVTLNDVPPDGKHFSLVIKEAPPLKVYSHSAFTNNILYADLIYPMPKVSYEELPAVGLFSYLLNQVGCGGRTYSDNLAYIQENTGGVTAAVSLNVQASDFASFTPTFHLRGKALSHKQINLFTLLKDMATSLDFTDHARLKEILLKHHTSLEQSLSTRAMKYAISLSASGLDHLSAISYCWSGIRYLHYIRELALNIDSAIPKLTEQFQQMAHRFLCNEQAHLVVTGMEEALRTLEKDAYYGICDLPFKKETAWHNHFPIAPLRPTGKIISSPVAFTGLALKTVPYIHPDAPAMNLIAQIMDNAILHTKLREQGGAYGGGASTNSLYGHFYFYAYRDPNIASTLSAFEEAIAWTAAGKFSDEQLEEAKLESIQSLDSPVAPGSRGELAYTWIREGKTEQIRKDFRNRLLSMGKEEVQKAAEAHVLSAFSSAIAVSFAGKEMFEKENKNLEFAGRPPLTIEQV